MPTMTAASALTARISLEPPPNVDPTKTIPAFGDGAVPRLVRPTPSHGTDMLTRWFCSVLTHFAARPTASALTRTTISSSLRPSSHLCCTALGQCLFSGAVGREPCGATASLGTEWDTLHTLAHALRPTVYLLLLPLPHRAVSSVQATI
jgi:hypothetical protein